MRFTVRFTESAVQDLEAIPAFHKRQIVDAIKKHLPFDARTPSRNRKLIKGTEAPWDALQPFWELRVGPYRVFYDVDEDGEVVAIRAVRLKPAGKTTKEIL